MTAGDWYSYRDYDNDGWPDITSPIMEKPLVPQTIMIGTFTDLAEKAGVTLGGWLYWPTWAISIMTAFLEDSCPGVKFGRRQSTD